MAGCPWKWSSNCSPQLSTEVGCVFAHLSSRFMSATLSLPLLSTSLAMLPWQPPLCCSHNKHQYSFKSEPMVKICRALWRLIHVRYLVLNYGWASRIKGLIPMIITTCQWHIPLYKMQQAQEGTHVCRMPEKLHHLRTNALLLTVFLTCCHLALWKLLTSFFNPKLSPRIRKKLL